jgi:WD40 repeat protein
MVGTQPVAVWLGVACLGAVLSQTAAAQEPKLIATLKWSDTGSVRSVAFRPDGKTVALGLPTSPSGSAAQTVKLVYVGTHEDLDFQGHTGSVWSVAFSPDGRTLASASSDKAVRLWEVVSGKERATLRGHTGYVDAVAFSPDGKTVASTGTDRTVRL